MIRYGSDFCNDGCSRVLILFIVKFKSTQTHSRELSKNKMNKSTIRMFCVGVSLLSVFALYVAFLVVLGNNHSRLTYKEEFFLSCLAFVLILGGEFFIKGKKQAFFMGALSSFFHFFGCSFLLFSLFMAVAFFIRVASSTTVDMLGFGDRKRRRVTLRELTSMDFNFREVHFHSIDGNRSHNSYNLHMLRTDMVPYIKLHGVTYFDDFQWPFCVPCDKRVFMRFLEWCSTRGENDFMVRALFLEGILYKEVFVANMTVFGVRWSARDMRCQLTEKLTLRRSGILLLTHVVRGIFKYDFLMMGVATNNLWLMNKFGQSLSACLLIPIHEELCKRTIIWLPIFEFWCREESNSGTVIVFFLHYVWLLLPLQYGIFGHVLWNTMTHIFALHEAGHLKGYKFAEVIRYFYVKLDVIACYVINGVCRPFMIWYLSQPPGHNDMLRPYETSHRARSCSLSELKSFHEHGSKHQLVCRSVENVFRAKAAQPVYGAVIGSGDIDSQDIADLSYIIDVMYKIRNKDLAGLALSVGMKSVEIENLCAMLGIKRVSDILHVFDFDFTSEDDCGLETESDSTDVCMLNEPNDWYTVFLPSFVAKSPMTKKIVAAVCLIFSSKYTKDIWLVKKLSHALSWDDLPEGDFLKTTTGCVASIIKGVTSVAKTGNWQEFFFVSDDVQFIERSRKLLFEIDPEDSKSAIMRKITIAEELIESRKFKIGDAQINRYCDQLIIYVNERKIFLKNESRRVPPMFVFLGGEPGVGKTTLFESAISLLRGAHNWEEFPGDVISYNITLKFPAETGIHRNARFVVINDAPADFSMYDSTDRIPLDVALQQLIDTYKVEIRSAAVEKKGLCLTDVAYVLLNSNFKEFVFPNPALKLIRRMEKGLLLWGDFIVDGKRAPFKEIEKLDDAGRAKVTKFFVQRVEAKSKHLTFINTIDEPLGSLEVLKLLLEKSRQHQEVCEKYRAKFIDESSKCACGAANVLHLDSEGVVRIISEKCKERIDTSMTLSFSDGVSSAFGFFFGSGFILLWLTLFCMAVWDKVNSFYVVKMEEKLLSTRLFRAFVEFKDDEVFTLKTKCYHFYLKIKLFYLKYKKELMIFCGAAGFALLYSVFRGKNKVETLGKAIFEKDVDPKSMFIDSSVREMTYPENIRRSWSKAEEEYTKIELKTRGSGREDLQRACKAQTLESVISHIIGGEHRSLTCTAFFISCEFFVMNRHYFREVVGDFVISFGEHSCHFSQADIRHPTERCEMVFLRNWWFKNAAPLHKFLAIKLDGALSVMNYKSGQQVGAQVSAFTSSADGKLYDDVSWIDSLEFPAKQGDCGTPIIGLVGGDWFIVGCVAHKSTRRFIGIFSEQKVVGAAVVLQKDYQKACDGFEPVVDSFDVDLEMLGAYSELSINSEFRACPRENVFVVGTLNRPTRSFKSKIRKTRFYDDISPLLSKEYAAPDKTKAVIDGEYTSAYMKQFRELDMKDRSLDREWKSAVLDFLDDVKPDVSLAIKLRPLTLAEALFGAPTVGIDRVDFKTSVGFAMREFDCKDKYDLFEKIDEDHYKLKECFKVRVDRLLLDLKKGKLHAPLVEYSPKDEVRPLVRINQGILRLFGVLDFHFNVCFRMLLMPLIQYLMGIAHKSECYGGMNAGSVQWHHFALRLLKHGHFIDMDFKEFDTHHKWRAFRFFAIFMRALSRMLGYTEDESNQVYWMCRTLECQIVIYMMNVAIKIAGMPSGVVITLILNSIINSLLMRIAFLRLCPGLKFKEHVETGTVGDDNASSISSVASPRYNMTTIQVEYVRLGYSVTPALKGDVVSAFVEFSDLSFVKRKFKWSPVFNMYQAPIEWDSILKPLCFEKLDMGTSSEQRLVDNALSGQRESFLHGREKFDEFQALMVATFKKYRIDHLLKLLTWEYVSEEFSSGTLKTWST